MRRADYLAFYAERFHTVEVDSTFYACPTARTVENWNARTPEGFVFSVKVPQTITHDKVLVDCDAELKEFLDTMGILRYKLGPVVFQFPFFDKWKIKDRHAFTDRLIPFLKKLPTEGKFAIEIRNKKWLDAELANLLRDHKIALVLQDRSWMPSPAELKFDPITTEWTYIRWLGDRKTIEEQTMTWDKKKYWKGERLIRAYRSGMSSVSLPRSTCFNNSTGSARFAAAAHSPCAARAVFFRRDLPAASLSFTAGLPAERFPRDTRSTFCCHLEPARNSAST
jgi:uncharacterized protein YecE (DUF72 family)